VLSIYGCFARRHTTGPSLSSSRSFARSAIKCTCRRPVWAVHGQRLFENAGACRQETWHRHGHMNPWEEQPAPSLPAPPFSNNRCTSTDARSSMRKDRQRPRRSQNAPTAPTSARRPRTRPLRPVKHRKRPRGAAALQRCPLQKPRQNPPPGTAERAQCK